MDLGDIAPEIVKSAIDALCSLNIVEFEALRAAEPSEGIPLPKQCPPVESETEPTEPAQSQSEPTEKEAVSGQKSPPVELSAYLIHIIEYNII